MLDRRKNSLLQIAVIPFVRYTQNALYQFSPGVSLSINWPWLTTMWIFTSPQIVFVKKVKRFWERNQPLGGDWYVLFPTLSGYIFSLKFNGNIYHRGAATWINWISQSIDIKYLHPSFHTALWNSSASSLWDANFYIASAAQHKRD